MLGDDANDGKAPAGETTAPSPATKNRLTFFGHSVSKRSLLVVCVSLLALILLAIALILCARFGVFDARGYVPPICNKNCSANVVNHSYWDGILKRHVRQAVLQGVPTAVFDYAALRTAPSDLEAYLAVLSSTAVAELPRNEQLAFWLNAYNALTVNWIVRENPRKSIKELGNLLTTVWRKKAGNVGGHDYTLDQIEHDIIRPVYGDARIHAAVNCASISCPDLRFEAYTGASLDAQLGEQVRMWLDNPGKGYSRSGASVELSKLFDWYGADFSAHGGPLAFILRSGLSDPQENDWLAKNQNSAVTFKSYNWDLNAAL